MNIKEIEMMLNLVATNRIEELSNYLVTQRQKYYLKKAEEEYTKTAYAAFLKYMCDLNTKPYYCHLNHKTIFNDDVSMFIINKEFEIGIDKCDINFSLNTLKNVKNMIQDKGIIDQKYKELSYYILKRGEIAYKFNAKYFEYINALIGVDVPLYIDKKKPIAYAESEHGMGYILGLKK